MHSDDIKLNQKLSISPKSDIEIIYEDGDILVVNKPAGVSVTKDRSDQTRPQIAAEQLIYSLAKN